jgi:hypothetical protein
VTTQLADRTDILNFVRRYVEMQGKAIWHSPEEYLRRSESFISNPQHEPYLAIVGSGSDQRVIERVPSVVSPCNYACCPRSPTSLYPKPQQCGLGKAVSFPAIGLVRSQE